MLSDLATLNRIKIMTVVKTIFKRMVLYIIINFGYQDVANRLAKDALLSDTYRPYEHPMEYKLACT